MEEASNASSPVSIVATGAYVFSLLVALDDPSGTAARVATLIPPVAPMVVPLRAALGAIEPWEIVLSAGLTAATIMLPLLGVTLTTAKASWLLLIAEE